MDDLDLCLEVVLRSC